MSILLGNGDGTFQNAISRYTAAYAISVAVGDFNGDGTLDVAVADAHVGADSVVVLLGNGNGTLQTAQRYYVGSSQEAVAVGDFNGDGILDLVTANDDGTVSVLVGNRDGSFRAPVIHAVGAHPDAVAVGDFNGDGIPDLAVANYSSHTMSILLVNRCGFFRAWFNGG